LFVLVFLFIFGEFEDSAGLGEVEAVRGGVETADDVGSVGFDPDAGGVGGGELKTVEQGGGAFGIEMSGGERVDDDGESDLNGFAVFEGCELNVLAGNKIAPGGCGVAVVAVALVKAIVEVAPLLATKGRCFALDSVGLDVSAEFVLHLALLWGVPPPGYVLKSQMIAIT
jgi:hypothetical protein